MINTKTINMQHIF